MEIRTEKCQNGKVLDLEICQDFKKQSHLLNYATIPERGQWKLAKKSVGMEKC